jgi:hypothetical protein
VIIAEVPASPGQRILWLLHHFRGGHGELNYPLLLHVRGPVNEERLQRAVNALVERHEALRTTFGRSHGLLMQLIHAPEPLPISIIRLEPASGSRLQQAIRAETGNPIDPTTTPMRLTLWSLGPDEHVLCINTHHLVTDAWSCRIVFNEFLLLLSGQEDLPAQGWQYRHFVQWQRRRSTIERQKADREYWNLQLTGVKAPALPSRAGPVREEDASRTMTAQLDVESGDWACIRRIARAEQATPFIVLLSIYYLLLYHETRDTDLAVCSPFANRARPEVMRTVGFFVNMLILRTALAAGSTFTQLIRSTQATVSAALAHQGFAHFLPSTGPRPAADRVENVVFQMLPALPPPARIGDMEINVLPPSVDSRFDLEFCVLPHESGGRILVQSSAGQLDNALSQRLLSGFTSIMERLASGSDFPLLRC